MLQDSIDYFKNEVIPIISKNFMDIMPDIDIIILGSVGLGIDDKLSDMEASIYLDENLWRDKGKQLQLLMNDCISKANMWKKEGSIICVHPTSWLLDGNSNKFLMDTEIFPWENVSIESLFTVQKNMIVYSSKGMLNKLRELTAPSKYPKYLWKKSLIIELKELIFEDYFELTKSVQRNNITEVNIIYGKTLERIYHIAFLISQQYYPWRTHLQWAFEMLSLSSTDLGSKISSLLFVNDWIEKLNTIDSIINDYKSYININKLIPEIEIMSANLEQELIWAERLAAWNRPNWRTYIEECKKAALDNGYSPNDFWVWSLWK